MDAHSLGLWGESVSRKSLKSFILPNIQWTFDLQTARLTDFSSYRLLWLQNLGSTCSRTIDLQTRKKPKRNKNGTKTDGYRLIGFQCIVGQWSLDLQTFWPAATIPIWINSLNWGSTVLQNFLSPIVLQNMMHLTWTKQMWPPEALVDTSNTTISEPSIFWHCGLILP